MKRPKPRKILIVGYGNPLRSDDGFGWQASQNLARALAGREVEVMTCHQLTPELAEPLSRCALAIFLDADARGSPGTIHCRNIKPVPPTPDAFTHNCTPAHLLASAHRLYGSMPRGVSITVSAETFAFGDRLSPVVAAAVPKVMEQVTRLVERATAGSAASVPKQSGRRSSRRRKA